MEPQYLRVRNRLVAFLTYGKVSHDRVAGDQTGACIYVLLACVPWKKAHRCIRNLTKRLPRSLVAPSLSPMG